MKPNIGVTDQLIRMGLGLTLVAIGAPVAMNINTLAGILLLSVGAFSAYEAAARWCVVYELLGKNTCQASER
ncbi:YgaP family membrane protein [Methanocella arvoryzae]|uniref:Inner membrane protein YgaP-like transmembrane domain-containing protein n=1 Tax=Methanocella arvoryzae (strain DSM 22066 / NBRC 105507 / MRE50) TaxID=351160 RepID=Q0W535_METAR|nr:DUF2892 domain-containing protein [Methanocella arvoryzae]CAJ36508.1 hypothetical protein RCIX1203 [Methanocella arvoryzae MRE50]